ncbi:hypothetical protein ACSBR1_017862 [Camellia fascicularis]
MGTIARGFVLDKMTNTIPNAFKVQLNFTIKSFLYNTTQAYYKCSLSHRLCSLKLFLLRANAAVLTSPATEQVKNVMMSICFFNLTIYFLKSCP